MSYTVSSVEFPSVDGRHTLSGTVYRPDGEIKGIFHIVHGMTEYIKRYAPLFEAAAERGFIAFGYDHLGHGETARDDSELGYFAEKNGYDLLVRDVLAAEDKMLEQNPGLPLILMGHSMGSFISRLAAERGGERLSGLIICGTGGPRFGAEAGLLICDIEKLIFGERHISKTIEIMTFGSYNKRFPGGSKYAWITKDKVVIAEYEKDKYCTFHFTVSALHDLVKLSISANRRDWFLNMRKDLPVLIVSGEDDPVGDYGRGVTKVYDRLKAAGAENVTLHLYENGRHEIHNDDCRAELFGEIGEFLDSCAAEAEK